jgi:general secretion pathway protein D
MRNRRIALKASVPLWTGCVALGLSLSITESLAAAPQAGVWAVAAASFGQFGGSRDKRIESEKLLTQARGAIKLGEYDRAESLIAQAEKLAVKYDPLMERFVDTPDKIRKLLAEQRSKAAVAGRTGPRAPALLSGDTQGPSATTVPADPLQVGPQSINPQAEGAATNSAAERLTNDGKSRATMYLTDARTALAHGDKLAALAAWQKAAGINAAFAPGEVSPQSVADELLRAGIDPSRLIPVSASPASPYVLKPSDIDPASESLPPLLAQPGATAPPGAIGPGSQSPYNLPRETNRLAQSGPQRPGEPQRLPVGDANAKLQAARLVAQARVALDKGDLAGAGQFAEQAEALNLPDEAFAASETRPWQMVLEVNRAMSRRQGVVQAGGTAPVGPEPQYPVVQGVYDPAADTTRTVPASSSQTSNLSQPPAAGPPAEGQRLYEEGLRALEAQDRQAAMQKFTEAWRHETELDPATRQQLKDKLSGLRANNAARPLPAGDSPSPLEQVSSQQELLRQKLGRELSNEEKAATELAQTDPKQALSNLKKFRDRISSAEIDPAAKKYMLTMVDQKISQLANYIDQNKATIENSEKNNAIKAGVVRSQEVTSQTQNKLAEMVEQFNKLMDERRFPEAEVLARQARDIAPNESVVVNMLEKAKLAHAIAEDLSIKERTENGFLKGLQSLGESGIPFDDRNPFVFGDMKKWSDLTRSRSRLLSQQHHLSPVEQEIQKSLSKPVEVKFINRPLAEVMDTLGRMAGINVYLDPQGLHAEGVTSDSTVTLNLTQPISLRSALNLVLSPLGLSYVIRDEVLRITSEQTKDANTYPHVYYVADLVMPIPNFVPSYNLGLPGAIRESLNAMRYGMPFSPSGSGGLTLAKTDEPATMMPPGAKEILAQVNQPGGSSLPLPGGRNQQMPGGPGGLGGGVIADFDSLIDLITTTISPQSWDAVGGPGTVEGFPTNLSLVVSQTQDVHEQIADLLQQLRRLQDLQVTIEVRFITLSDNFFERIGVDFQFAIDDNTGLNNINDQLPVPPGPGTGSANFDDSHPSVAIGWTPSGVTGDLDIPFTQGSFAGSNPPFGGFDVNTAANFGFAILSDIQVFFLVQAAQGDNRSNILQAPKVTLFNGQTAFVSDTTQRPFVTSVIPVVGDFAAAQMPVIVVLNEGTSMSVQAVVSADRRFVRLTLVPFFSQIGAVNEFTFTGSTTTDSGTTVQDPSNPDQNVTNGQTRTVSGTTVQLPTFAFTTVTTTVSVPDGGTVLLGGIKRLREGRTERGVPILSKLPWISRLFKNVGVGREAQSLMMMVTPRIIIQEEEEEKLGIEVTP